MEGYLQWEVFNPSDSGRTRPVLEKVSTRSGTAAMGLNARRNSTNVQK
jgi:hypothetical protein